MQPTVTTGTLSYPIVLMEVRQIRDRVAKLPSRASVIVTTAVAICLPVAVVLIGLVVT